MLVQVRRAAHKSSASFKTVGATGRPPLLKSVASFVEKFSRLTENMRSATRGATRMHTDFALVRELYGNLPDKIRGTRKLLDHPLTFTEKILYSHLTSKPESPLIRAKDYVDLSPDRVAMQDATAQMA